MVENYYSNQLGENDIFSIVVATNSMCKIYTFFSSKTPHLTICDGLIWDCTKCARISLFDASYVHCTDCDLPEWIFTEAEVKNIIELLSGCKDISQIKYNKSIWDTMIDAYNYNLDACRNEPEIAELPNIPADLQMPDYTKLK